MLRPFLLSTTAALVCGCGDLLGLDDFADRSAGIGGAGSSSTGQGADGAISSSASGEVGGQSASSGASSVGGTGGATVGPGGGGSVDDPKRVFVTKQSFLPATIDSVPGANTLCQSAALNANLGGTWQAWFSDKNKLAKDNITGNGPWELLNGTPVFQSYLLLTGVPGVPSHAITIAEDMSSPPVLDRVWTGTTKGGGAGDVCEDLGADWANSGSAVGTTGIVGQPINWTDAIPSLACNASHHLYCFEM